MNANLYALLRSHFAEHLEQPCVLIPGGPVIHYDDLDAASARIAHALLAAGCAIGDRVAVQTDKCWQQLALYLACLRAGLVYLPLNTGYRRTELAYFFGDAEPRVIVCAPADAVRHHCAAHRRDGADPCGRRGQPARSRSRPAVGVRHRRLGPRRSRGAALHLGDDRPLEGGDADAPQSRHQRARPGRALGVYARRCAAARFAAVPRARPVRRLPLRAAVGRPDAVAAEIRCRGSGEAFAARHGDDGRSDVLLAPAWRPRVRRRGLPHDPRVHLRLGAAAGGDVQRVCRAHRTVDRRTLRHDRNRHEYVQSARRRAPVRQRRPCTARHQRARRRGRRRNLRAGRR